MATISTSGFRNGLKIELNGEPFLMVEFQHVKPGKGGAFVRTKIKSLKTGLVLERTFRSGEKIGLPDLEEKEMQYLYKDAGLYYFMDKTSFEQLAIGEEVIGGNKNFLGENLTISVLFHNGHPIGINLPIFVNLRVKESEPGIKGDTASGATKLAKLETGYTVQVPLFIDVSDVLKIDTRNGGYIERVK